MTVEIKHNQSFWEQGPQNAEEIHAVQQLQTGLYNIRSDTHIGITWEENERDAVFVLYMLEGEMQFQSSSEVFSLKFVRLVSFRFCSAFLFSSALLLAFSRSKAMRLRSLIS